MEVKRKNWIKVLSCFLAALMVIQILPLSVFANDVQNNLALNSVPETEAELGEMKIVDEIEEESSEYSKTYLLENGMYCEISSNEVIDNTQNSEESSYSTINEVTASITSLSNEPADENSDKDVNLNDGLVIQDQNQNLNIYGAELTEDADGNYYYQITNGSGKIAPLSYILVKPNIANASLSYEKAQVTIDATLNLQCNQEFPSETGDSLYIRVFKDGWSGDSFSPEFLLEEYETENGEYRFTNVADQIYDYNSVSTSGEYTWNITSAYCKWENGTENNNGLIISAANPSDVYITSGILVRYYRIVDENDSGFNYHTEDMGRAGTLYINNYTNIPTLKREELSLNGGQLPVSISRSINVGCSDSSFGAGGRWNYESELTYSSNTFIWNTFDGSSKRFQRSSNNETDENGREKWVEYLYNGGECVLWVTPSSINHTPYDFSNNIIIDEEGNTYAFNSYNKVISVTNGDATLTIEYDSGNKIDGIVDSMGRRYVFNNNGFIAPYSYTKNIKIKNSKETIINYSENIPYDIDYTYIVKNNTLCLSTATYADDKTVEYEYDDYGRLKTIKNIDNSKLVIDYYNDVSENPNPIYFSRITSYTKYLYDTENKTYIKQKEVEFNANDTYRRTVKTTENNKSTIETSQYNTNLDLLYLTDSDGFEYYADYDTSHNLQSFVVDKDNNENLVKNGDMRKKVYRKNYPEKWSFIEINEKQCRMPKRGEDYCVEFESAIGKEYGLEQTISEGGKKGDKFVISAWGKAECTIPRNSRFWGVEIWAVNEDGHSVPIHEMAFDTSLWGIEQTRKTVFSLPFDTSSITIKLLSCNQLNPVQFDDIELYKTEDSYVASVDDATTSTCPCSNCTEPNCPCDCTEEKSCQHVFCKRGTSTVKNENGKNITTTTDGVNSIITEEELTASSNFLKSYLDEYGTTTYYDYDENNGSLKSIAKGKGNDKTTYTYNAVGYLETVSQTVTNIISGASVEIESSYLYDGDTLKSITHNGTTYSFDYDVYGNVKSVKVGDQSLANYSYSNADSLNQIVYGNGDKIIYAYNDIGKIESISTIKAGETDDALTEYSYQYSENKETIENAPEGASNIIKCIDNVNNTSTLYCEETTAYKDYYAITDNTSGDTLYSSYVDKQTGKRTQSLFNKEILTKDEEPAYSRENAQTTLSRLYENVLYEGIMGKAYSTTDYFDRKVESGFSLNEPSSVRENFYRVVNHYEYSNENGITNKSVKSLTSKIEGSDYSTSLPITATEVTTEYEYDNAGRISKIITDNSLTSQYQYDEAGQLTQEINLVSEDKYRAVKYTYDTGGNISTKTYYDSVTLNSETGTFALGEVSDTISYGYDNTWTDLLKSYNNVNIEYDNMGNPLNYVSENYVGEKVEGTMKWNGRQLTEVTTSLSGELEKFKYYYNAEGLRTKKECYIFSENTNDFTLCSSTDYVWKDGILEGYRYSSLLDANNPIVYVVEPLYNEDGEIFGIITKSPVSDKDEDDIYYFLKDAQGNIVKMFSAYHSEVQVDYTYDAYGKTHSLLSGRKIDQLNNDINSTDTSFEAELKRGMAKLAYAGYQSVFKDINIFTYRGYMYDGETGMYYNQSRYYSPEYGRFINADDPLLTNTGSGNTNANNMFAYCENNPVNYVDPLWEKDYRRNNGYILN